MKYHKELKHLDKITRQKMILKIVSVKDRALNAYGRPIFVHTEGQAIRSFQDGINSTDKTNELAQHPDDYDLYFLGNWDDSTGKFIQADDAPTQIAIGKQLKTTQD